MVALNYARDVRIGDKPARAVALGSNFVWPTLPERLFLRGQSMVYDFVGQKYAARLPDNTIDYTTNVNDLGILTRASEATYWGPSGTLLEAAVDEARIQHDPVTGGPLGLLIESSATNLVINADILALPGGYSANNRFVEDAVVTAAVGVTDVSGDEGAFHASVPTPRNSRFGYARALDGQEGVHTMSVFLRAVEGQSGHVTMRLGATGGAYTTVFVDDSRWYRAEFSAESSTSLSHFYICDRRVEDSALNNLDEFYFCFAQTEVGSYLTSYIPTAGAPVTRAADEVSIDLSDVFNPDEGTLRITAQVPEGGVVASLGDRHVISDSSEFKEYDLHYLLHSGNTVAQLGEGIFNKVEYFPAMQGESDLGDLIRTLYGNGEQGAMYTPKPQVLGQQVLWQDAEGTVPVTADGDPVGLMLDLSGNNNHASQETSAARPIYRTDGVLHWLEFDGVDDSLSTTTFQHTGEWYAVASVITRSGNGSVFDSGEQAQQLRTISGNFGSVRYNNAGSPLVINTNVSVLEAVHVLTAIAATDTSRLRIDGNETLTQGYSDTSSSIEETLTIGRRSRGAPQSANMDLYGGIYVCSGAQQVEMAERYLATLAGVTL